MQEFVRKLSFGFYGLSGVLTAVGFRVMYHYGNYDDKLQLGDKTGHIVGGDAYNYIIIAMRAVGYLVTALTAAVIATGLFLHSSRKREVSE